MMIWSGREQELITCLFLSLFMGMLLDVFYKNRFAEEEYPLQAWKSVVITFSFISLYGFTIQALQCILFCQVLAVGAYYDLKTHLVPDAIPVLLLLTGLLDFSLQTALAGLLVVPLPFLAAALVKEGSIGGGDIKLMGAAGFVLGVQQGITALLIGLFMAVVMNLGKDTKKEQKAVALVPYLELGCFLALF